MQEQAVASLDASLDKNSSSLDKIAALLSGQKICEAAALATAAGNVRLAIVIIQVTFASELFGVCHCSSSQLHRA